MVDFDAYAYFELEYVPDYVTFPSKSKKLEAQKSRIKEFHKYLHFAKPDGLNILESKYAEGVGLEAVVEYLSEMDFVCDVRWSYRD